MRGDSRTRAERRLPITLYSRERLESLRAVGRAGDFCMRTLVRMGEPVQRRVGFYVSNRRCGGWGARTP